MDTKTTEIIQDIFSRYPEVKLAYFFGSRVKGKDGPQSDYDFAVYFDERDVKKMFDSKAKLHNELSHLLKTDSVDVVVLNTVESPELKYAIIKEGKILLSREPFKVLIEPKILNEYFDFHLMLKRYNLTRS